MENYKDHFNSQQAQVKLPNTIIMSILFILGIAGNITVIFVYKLKLKSTQKERFFIPAIALTDLTASVLGGTLAFLRNTYTVTSTPDTVCKGLWYMTVTVSMVSAFLLTVIAISRYYKICKPTKTVWILKNIKLTVFITVIFAALSSIPLLFLRGLRPLKFKVFNSTVTGFSCTDVETSCASFKAWKYVYNSVLLSILVSISILSCVVYARIGRIIYRNFGTFAHKAERSTIVLPDRNDNSDLHESHLTHEPVSEFTQTFDADTEIPESNTREVNCTTSNRKRKSIRTRRKRTRNNFTYMFICVTFISIGTYLPSVAFFIIPGEDPEKFWMELSPVKHNFFLTLSRMFMFAHASNPITYLYFDLAFRRALIHLIRKGKNFILRKEN